MNDPTPSPGSRLKAERERRGLSAQKAADEMHLDAWVIDALEAGDYARIGPTVYAKGHLRKYATMLGLPPVEIMADFEPQHAEAGGREGTSIPLGSRHGAAAWRVTWGYAAAGVAAVILLGVLVWWQPWRQRARAPAAGAPAASASAPEPGTAANGDGSDAAAAVRKVSVTPASAGPALRAPAVHAPAVSTVSRPGGGAPGGAGAPAGGTQAANTPAAVSSAAAATPGAGRARLRLSFSSDSWVDVRDALGNRAYAGNGSANTVKSIAGNAPLHVYLRSANGVQLEINGRAVAIGPQFFSGDVARFEAGADGVLRRDTSHDAPRSAQTPARPPG